MNLINSLHHKTLAFTLSKKKQQQFLLLLSVISWSSFGYQLYLAQFSWPLLITGAFTLLTGLLIPVIAIPFLYIWMLVGNILGEISSLIVLSIIYFLVFYPIRLIKGNRNTSSGWQKISETTNFEEQF